MRIVTSMDTPKYGETLKFVLIKYQPILVKCLPKVCTCVYLVTVYVSRSVSPYFGVSILAITVHEPFNAAKNKPVGCLGHPECLSKPGRTGSI